MRLRLSAPRIVPACCFVMAAGWLPATSLAITPDDPGPGDVALTISSGQNVRPISQYIYGMNSFFNSLPGDPYSAAAITLDRLGGNRWTGYNWETNYSNAGSDWQHVNDDYLVDYQWNTPPGEAVRPSLVNAATYDRALLVTVPIAGYVSADHNGTVTVEQTAPSSRWKGLVAKKSTIYPGSPLSLTPNESDNYVFTDEFVNWVQQTKQAGQTVFYGLDNEPALWDSTHPRLHPGDPTFAEVKSKTIQHAGAVKDVAPGALVFGPTLYGWGAYQTLQDAPDYTSSPAHPGNADLDFVEWYLNEIRQEETTQGRALVDVLDLHWYPEAKSGTDPDAGTRITFGGANDNSPEVVAARVEAPRSLWDPTYTENSWIARWSTSGPINLLDRVQADIDTFKPGTKLAITEYNYGGGGHISGAIAQADVLGVFGREGLFAASWWNIEGGDSSAVPYTYAAFNMYRNYDGAGGSFGDVSVDAATDNIAASAVYASVDSEDPNRMVLVAINRTDAAQDAAIQITHDRIFDHAEVYRIVSGDATPDRLADIELSQINALHYTMPAWSVTTLVLISDGLPGDYNHDGSVDAADYTVWRDSLSQTGDAAADGNEDNVVDEDDYLLWRASFGRTEAGSGAGADLGAVPEPAGATLLCMAGIGLALCLRRVARPQSSRSA